MTWEPIENPLMTPWAEDLTPENAWQEYPRPQMTRPDWLNLNGLWAYGVAPKKQAYPSAPQGQILVPFAIESALSGVKRALQPDERLWYHRRFTIPKAWQGQRVRLHFEAVDWQATVKLNGHELGVHTGGFLPFSFDVTPYLQPGENDLWVAVWDPTDTHWQARGKQVLEPESIWYTAVSGIWQTVWLEPVPAVFIERLKLTPDVDAGTLRVEVELGGAVEQAAGVSAEARDAGMRVAAGRVDSPGEAVVLSIPNARLWSPDSPHLYDLTVRLEGKDEAVDQVESYFGMRKFSLGRDAAGRPRMCLNDQPLFQYGPLDQGYWPDGLLTPPSEAAMRSDLELIKSLGFNMLRKHIKVEPARFYYDCDHLGLIVWQDMMSGSKPVGDFISAVATLIGWKRSDDRRYHLFGRQDPKSREDYKAELKGLIDHLYNFACIGMWVPFNEGWGQFDAKDIAAWAKAYDPTRLVDHASGWFDQGGGDFKSKHVYFRGLPSLEPEAQRASILSEFGGYSLKIPGHVWNPEVEFGYRKYPTPEALTEAYVDLLEKQLLPRLAEGLSGAVYTQTTDVEIEVNGYVTYDRKVPKMDFEQVRQVHRKLMEAAGQKPPQFTE